MHRGRAHGLERKQHPPEQQQPPQEPQQWSRIPRESLHSLRAFSEAEMEVMPELSVQLAGSGTLSGGLRFEIGDSVE